MRPTCIAFWGERECRARVRVPALLDPAEGVALAQNVLSKHIWSFIFKLTFIHNRSSLWFLYVRSLLLCHRCFSFFFFFFSLSYSCFYFYFSLFAFCSFFLGRKIILCSISFSYLSIPPGIMTESGRACTRRAYYDA